MKRALFIGLMLAAGLAGCGYTRLPEETTDDGLVRVPSRASGGVYRNPAADFTPYKRIILEPPTIEFVKDWRDEHKEVDDKELARLRGESVKLFRDEFDRELIKRGNYVHADAPAPDVILVTPRVVDLDILAPDAGTAVGERTYTPGPVKMQVTGELRDSVTNTLLARIIIFEGQSRYGMNELRPANRSTNAHEMRIGYGKWAMMVHEALNVAKVAKPR
jgi:uncharacterized protein DUF3313